jgi:hypothetical protein
MYRPLKDWQKQHADIIGTTGAGKGVAAGILLYQSILAGEGVFVMDPKDDEWAPHLYRKACEDAGKPFALIDLRKQQYQLNLIEDITPDELEELFVAGFSLAEKGQESDFYRIDDRKAARMAAQFVSDNPSATIRDVYNGDYVQRIAEKIKAFFGKIEELALLNAINSPEAFRLSTYLMRRLLLCCRLHAKQQNYYRPAHAAGSPVPVGRKARPCNRCTTPHCYLSFGTEIPFIQASAGGIRCGAG